MAMATESESSSGTKQSVVATELTANVTVASVESSLGSASRVTTIASSAAPSAARKVLWWGQGAGRAMRTHGDDDRGRDGLGRTELGDDARHEELGCRNVAHRAPTASGRPLRLHRAERAWTVATCGWRRSHDRD